MLWHSVGCLFRFFFAGNGCERLHVAAALCPKHLNDLGLCFVSCILSALSAFGTSVAWGRCFEPLVQEEAISGQNKS